MSVEQEILVTGIKVVDLLAPYAKGGKIGTWHPVGRGAPGEGGPHAHPRARERSPCSSFLR